LDSLNPSFFQLSVELTWRRLQAVKAISGDFLYSCQKLFPEQPNVDISVEYSFSEKIVNDFSREKIEKLIYDRMQQLRTAEISTGSSLVGPHKHQIKFLYNQNDSRFFCSQGQQRALILAFKMAQIVYHRKAYRSDPVLFLDDVLSELDEVRRQALIGFLAACEAQVFVTTTDFNLPESLALELGKRDCKVIDMNGRNE
jgi:DNA replication and repair protein RecF